MEMVKKYNIIYADPPWAYAWGKGKDGGDNKGWIGKKEVGDMK